jgi:hypothetical protein
MKVPGFTAEAALQANRHSYRMSRILGPTAGGSVAPAFFRCWGNYCCNEWGYCIYRGHVLM